MKITWLGHSAFHLEIDGTDILIDPFLTGNPKYPAGYDDKLAKVDAILVTHGHGDHVGDSARLAQKFDSVVVSQPEICQFLGRTAGLKKFESMNTGGAVKVGTTTVAMVMAFHSSAIVENGVVTCTSDPIGFVVSGGGHTVYHTGDTGLFGDMSIIQDVYQPDIGLIPIGDRYTMGPTTAAYACNKLLNLKTVIPMHYGTFPALSGKVEDFAPLVKRGAVRIMTPGETIEV